MGSEVEMEKKGRAFFVTAIVLLGLLSVSFGYVLNIKQNEVQLLSIQRGEMLETIDSLTVTLSATEMDLTNERAKTDTLTKEIGSLTKEIAALPQLNVDFLAERLHRLGYKYVVVFQPATPWADSVSDKLQNKFRGWGGDGYEVRYNNPESITSWSYVLGNIKPRGWTNVVAIYLGGSEFNPDQPLSGDIPWITVTYDSDQFVYMYLPK